MRARPANHWRRSDQHRNLVRLGKLPLTSNDQKKSVESRTRGDEREEESLALRSDDGGTRDLKPARGLAVAWPTSRTVEGDSVADQSDLIIASVCLDLPG